MSLPTVSWATIATAALKLADVISEAWKERKERKKVEREHKAIDRQYKAECDALKDAAVREVLRHNSTGKADRLARLQAELEEAAKKGE